MNSNASASLCIALWAVVVGVGLTMLLAVMFGVFAAMNAFGRYQAVQNAENQVHINEITIAQQAQLINVEQQKAEIRVVEARGIAQAQEIINATLTDKYLQHEAIKAQEAMSRSPNHTTVYIPSGQNGLPIVRTDDGR